MKSFRKKFSAPRRREDESPVQNDLAYTPSEMLQMAEQGIAVSAQNLASTDFFDGVPFGQGSFELPVDRMRGVDIADCWQASTSVKKKAKKGLKNDVSVYGAPSAQKGE